MCLGFATNGNSMFIADIGYLSFIENCIVLNVKQFYTGDGQHCYR